MWAPDTSSFGYDSRAASIRIISAPGVNAAATRFEVRVPGADVSGLVSATVYFGPGLCLLGLRRLVNAAIARIAFGT
jgi:glutamine synthetase